MAGPPPYLESQESCQCLSKSRRKYERAPPPTRPALPSPKLLNFSLFGNSNFWSSSHNLGGLEKGHEATGNPHQEPASAADPGGTRGHWCAGPRRNAQGCTAAATGTGTGARGWRGRAEAARPAPPAPHTRPLSTSPQRASGEFHVGTSLRTRKLLCCDANQSVFSFDFQRSWLTCVIK